LFSYAKFIPDTSYLIDPQATFWLQAKPVQNSFNGKNTLELMVEKVVVTY
jgi:hypothetical protein